MIEDPKWELAILATVQGFYERLLQAFVGGEVPVPATLEAVSLQNDDVMGTLSSMHRWLRVLDLAITAAMLRRALTPDTDPEIAEAMLRYFIRKKDASDVNRDKADVVVTFLFRHPRVSGQWERRGYGLDGSLPLSPFEIALTEILADADSPSLSEEHMQFLRQFDLFEAESQNFRDLNTLLDSAVIPKVRELKQSFGPAFYHPSVLATVASYNTGFGKKFDELFFKATAEIKTFASVLEEHGGSILGNVDGVDVTVEHVAALKESELLRIDYGGALEKFHRISKLKQTLAQHPPVRRAPVPIRPAVAAKAGGPEKLASPVLDLAAMRAAVTPQQISTEESKVRRIEESIRVFVRVADPKFRHVVPMRFFNLILTQAEADAYCADYLQEKTMRAQVARVLLRTVAAGARMTTELEELKRCENSQSLWKLHADSLVVLLEVAPTTTENANGVMSLAKQQRCAPEGEEIQLSLAKLQHSAELVLKALTAKSVEKATGAGSGK